jgi:hypothetical protein
VFAGFAVFCCVCSVWTVWTVGSFPRLAQTCGVSVASSASHTPRAPTLLEVSVLCLAHTVTHTANELICKFSLGHGKKIEMPCPTRVWHMYCQ